MKLLIAIGLIGWGVNCSWAKTDIREFPANQIKDFQIRNTSGKIEIAATKTGKAVVVSEKKKWSPKCVMKIQHTEATGQLIIEVEDESWILENECEINFIVSLPERVNQKIYSGSGDIEIVGTKGAVDVKSGSGDVEIKSEVTQLQLVSGSGKVEVDQITSNQAQVKTGSGDIRLKLTPSSKGELYAHSGSGDIRIAYGQKPQGLLDIRTGSGDVDVTLPKGSSILSELISGSGTIKNDFPNAKRPSLKITAKAGSGDLLIKTAR